MFGQAAPAAETAAAPVEETLPVETTVPAVETVTPETAPVAVEGAEKEAAPATEEVKAGSPKKEGIFDKYVLTRPYVSAWLTWLFLGSSTSSLPRRRSTSPRRRRPPRLRRPRLRPPR